MLLPDDTNYTLVPLTHWTEYDLLETDNTKPKYCQVGMFIIAGNPIDGSTPIIRTPTERLIQNDLSIVS